MRVQPGGGAGLIRVGQAIRGGAGMGKGHRGDWLAALPSEWERPIMDGASQGEGLEEVSWLAPPQMGTVLWPQWVL